MGRRRVRSGDRRPPPRPGEGRAARHRRVRAGRVGSVQRSRPPARPRPQGQGRAVEDRTAGISDLVSDLGRRREARPFGAQCEGPDRAGADRSRIGHGDAHRPAARRRRRTRPRGDGRRSRGVAIEGRTQPAGPAQSGRRPAGRGDGGGVSPRTRPQGRARRPARRPVAPLGAGVWDERAGGRRGRPRPLLRRPAPSPGRAPAGDRTSRRGAPPGGSGRCGRPGRVEATPTT